MPKSNASNKPHKPNKFVQSIAAVSGDAVVAVPAKSFKPDVLASALSKAGFQVTIIDPPSDANPIQDKATLLRAIHHTRTLPAHFGFNWDALVDSLSDLPEPDAKGYALILRQPNMLREQSPEDYALFLKVIQTVSDRWAARGVPFKLVVPE